MLSVFFFFKKKPNKVKAFLLGLQVSYPHRVRTVETLRVFL